MTAAEQVVPADRGMVLHIENITGVIKIPTDTVPMEVDVTSRKAVNEQNMKIGNRPVFKKTAQSILELPSEGST